MTCANEADLVERVARIIAPSTWATLDGYLEQTKREFRGQNVGWPADQFQDKESMAKAREIIGVVRRLNRKLHQAMVPQND